MKHLLFLIFFATVSSMCSNQEKIMVELNDTSFRQKLVPLFADRQNEDIFGLAFTIPDTAESVKLESVSVYLKDNSVPDFLESLEITYSDADSKIVFSDKFSIKNNRLVAIGAAELEPGNHSISFHLTIKEDAMLDQSFSVEGLELKFKGRAAYHIEANSEFRYRPALIVRAAGQDNCDTYRIPGLVTTNSGTLIAVYDNRYNNSKDLQEDIDVGMSRSTDGGQTWEPMQVIMDMGEWGGRSERLNGIGDPCVLYDHTRNTLWVAGLWMSGGTEERMLWVTSNPGMSPEETGQFMLVKSTDDGITWSAPINITGQIKDPEWQLLLQGPGRGITLDDGTLIFPAQFKADIDGKELYGGQYTPHATVVYSKDSGETWHIGTGAKENTTEAQVVQLTDGSLMLNMRDNQNRKIKDDSNGRAVAVTNDFGNSWTIHPSSNSALPEPGCMASLITADINVNEQKQQVLLFSNPNDKYGRQNMTIKISFDDGLTWPEQGQVLLNENKVYGYSCMTMVDENNVGILYEGIKELYFQKVPINEFLDF